MAEKSSKHILIRGEELKAFLIENQQRCEYLNAPILAIYIQNNTEDNFSGMELRMPDRRKSFQVRHLQTARPRI